MNPDLHELLVREGRATGDCSGGTADRVALRDIGEELARLAASAPSDALVQLHHNRFRLSHPALVSQDRPKVLLGGRNDAHFPSVSTLPLLRVADVVSLTTRSGPERPDRLRYDYWNERLVDVLPRLPAGFRPDVYLDGGLSQRPCVPLGLEEAPFLTVAELDDAHPTQELLAAAGLFDVLVPRSRSLARTLEGCTETLVLQLPFGLASEHADPRVTTREGNAGDAEGNTDRIDVLILLEDATSALTSFLTAAAQRMRARAGSRAAIVLLREADAEARVAAIARSRVVVRAVTPEQPHDGITATVLAAGALLVELERHQGCNSSQLVDGTEVVRVTPETLEERLDELLSSPQRIREIAWTARGRQEQEYASEGLYRKLFEALEDIEALEKRPPRLLRSHAYFALGTLQLGTKRDAHRSPEAATGALAALPGVLAQPLSERIPNLTALVPRLFEQHDRERVLELLEREPAVVEAFRIDGWTGVEALACTFPEHMALRFNHAFLSVEAGKAATPVLTAALRLLDTRPAPFDLRTTLLVRPSLADLEPEERSVETELLHRPFLKALGDDEAEWNVVCTYMRWHLVRWVYQNDPADTERLAELLELWPGNAALQCRMGEHLAPTDQEGAKRAFESALEAHPEHPRAEHGLAALGIELQRPKPPLPERDRMRRHAA